MSNPSLAKTSSSPDARIHVMTSSENVHQQKQNMAHGNVQLSPIQDLDQHKESPNDNMILNRSDTKMSSRAALGLNISTPGADLPSPSSQGQR